MNPCELTLSITALANTIANGLNEEDLALTAALFTQLGDTLATISVQRMICSKKNDNPSCTQKSERSFL